MRQCLLIILQFTFVFTQAQTLGPNPLLVVGTKELRDFSRIKDSLHTLLRQSKEDTTKINLLLDLGGAYIGQSKTDSAFLCYQQALNLSQKRQFIRGMFDARRSMFILFRRSGNFAKALQLSLLNASLAEQYKDTLQLWLTLGELSGISDEMKDFHKQIAYIRKQYELANSGYFKRQKDTRNVDLPYFINMALAYTGLNQKDSAIYYYQRYQETALSLKNYRALTIVHGGLGDALLKFGDYNKAWTHYSQAILYANLSQFPFWVANSYLGWAKIYAQKKQLDSAIHYAKLCLYSFQQMKLPAREMNAASFLNELYAKEKQMDSAYRYMTLTVALKDSLFDLEKVKQMQNLQFDEMLRLQQREQERKEAQQQHNTRVKVFGLATGLVVLLFVAFMLYRNNQQKQKTNTVLQQKNVEINRQRAKAETALAELKAAQVQLVQREKMASLGELTAGIAHEIQNPLNFVNNFSETNRELLEELTQANKQGNPAEVESIATALRENEEKINHHGKRADAIVKSMLQHSRESSGNKQPSDLNKLVEEHLRLAYHGYRAKDQLFTVDFMTDYDPSVGRISIVPQEIGRVLLNLFNNAFYAVNEKKKSLNGTFEPVVSVTTKKEGNHIVIAVRDNGTGMPQEVADKVFQPFFTTKPTGEGTGLGLSLSYDVVTKGHGGNLTVTSKEGEGSEFFVELPTA